MIIHPKLNSIELCRICNKKQKNNKNYTCQINLFINDKTKIAKNKPKLIDSHSKKKPHLIDSIRAVHQQLIPPIPFFHLPRILLIIRLWDLFLSSSNFFFFLLSLFQIHKYYLTRTFRRKKNTQKPIITRHKILYKINQILICIRQIMLNIFSFILMFYFFFFYWRIVI